MAIDSELLSQVHSKNTPQHNAQLFQSATGLYTFPVRGKHPLKDVFWKENHQYPEKVWRQATGYGVRLDDHSVIDVDDVSSRNRLEAGMPSPTGELKRVLPNTLLVSTPRGGLHIYLVGELHRQSLRGGDLKSGDGSYVVGPGSWILQISYSIDNMGEILSLTTFADCNSASNVLNIMGYEEDGAEKTEQPSEPSPVVQKGQRNTALTSLAGSMRHLGFESDAILAALREQNKLVCVPPLPDHELTNMASQAERNWARGDITGVTKSEQSLKIYTASELADMPPPRYLIDELFPEGALSILYGKPASFKSFIALDWADALTRGRPLAGLADPINEEPSGISIPTPMQTLYVATEGGRGMGKRIRAAGFRDSEFGTIIDTPNLKGNWPIMEQAIRDPHNNFHIVVLDTLNRCAVGWDENSSLDMGRLVDLLCTYANREGIHFVVVHHSTKSMSPTLRGSSALLGAADNVWR